MVIFMEITPFYISRVKAAMYNISLVSQIFYSYIIEVIFYQESVSLYNFKYIINTNRIINGHIILAFYFY